MCPEEDYNLSEVQDWTKRPCGSQIIAAEQLGRRCYALEISPAYCDVIANRWAAFTGEEPRRIAAEEKAPDMAEAVGEERS